MAWQHPKTDWVINPKSPVGEDFNRIEGNIDFLKADIETKKGAIVNALNTVGLETQLTDTHAQIANKIVAANQGTKIYTPSTVNQPIPKGFHSGQGYVKGDANLKPENIRQGVSIFGIMGACPETARVLVAGRANRPGRIYEPFEIGYISDPESASWNFRENEGIIYLHSGDPYSGSLTAVTVNLIDVTRYSTMIVFCSGSYSAVGLTSKKNIRHNQWEYVQYPENRSIEVYDISSITGSWYIGCASRANEATYFYLILLCP